jgi:hypothetical protein
MWADMVDKVDNSSRKAPTTDNNTSQGRIRHYASHGHGHGQSQNPGHSLYRTQNLALIQGQDNQDSYNPDKENLHSGRVPGRSSAQDPKDQFYLLMASLDLL